VTSRKEASTRLTIASARASGYDPPALRILART
jgi:hypothetical protein